MERGSGNMRYLTPLLCGNIVVNNQSLTEEETNLKLKGLKLEQILFAVYAMLWL